MGHAFMPFDRHPALVDQPLHQLLGEHPLDVAVADLNFWTIVPHRYGFSRVETDVEGRTRIHYSPLAGWTVGYRNLGKVKLQSR
ncbi:hypothetical protein D3C86_1818810 [compost metagenome]